MHCSRMVADMLASPARASMSAASALAAYESPVAGSNRKPAALLAM